MSDPNRKDQMATSTRRGFFKGMGAGALGLSMLGGAELRGADRGDGDVTEAADLEKLLGGGVCNAALLSTDRRAELLTPPGAVTLDCQDCPCDSPNQPDNFLSRVRFVTTFSPSEPICDELGIIGISDAATMQWLLQFHFLRLTGPCGTPIGFFQGRFKVRDFDAAGNPVVRFIGRVSGTIGFDPCAPPGAAGCCDYPRVVGTLTGFSVPDGVCLAHWSFCGSEDFGLTPCDVGGWGVRITGPVVCNCPL